jgi:hypothetical protein
MYINTRANLLTWNTEVIYGLSYIHFFLHYHPRMYWSWLVILTAPQIKLRMPLDIQHSAAMDNADRVRSTQIPPF